MSTSLTSKLPILDHFRNHLGRNDNPNAVEFESASKRLLVCHPLLTSVDHNAISNATGILTVSSVIKKKLPLPPAPQVQVLELELSYEAILMNEIESMDQYEEHMCAYIALCIEEKFIQNIKNNRYKCKTCEFVLTSAGDKIQDDLLAMKAKEKQQPSRSTFKLVIFANSIMKMYSAERDQGNSSHAIMQTIVENLETDDLYDDFHVSHHEQDGLSTQPHKEDFISQLVTTYMTLKAEKICKKITEQERGKLIRYTSKRDVIDAGQ